MSIPLVQEATKDAINTSIIAIKRNIERINMLLGLVDSGSPDLSGLATKQELEDAITQVETDLAPVDEVTSGNMQSVTSNAVAKATEFKFFYRGIGANSKTLPESFKELFIVAGNTTGGYTYLNFTGHILYENLPNSGTKIYEFGCGGASGWHGFECKVSKTKFEFVWGYQNNTNLTSSYGWDIYYK